MEMNEFKAMPPLSDDIPSSILMQMGDMHLRNQNDTFRFKRQTAQCEGEMGRVILFVEEIFFRMLFAWASWSTWVFLFWDSILTNKIIYGFLDRQEDPDNQEDRVHQGLQVSQEDRPRKP